MPIEMEAKFRVGSHDSVRERLTVAGAACEGVVVETNVILDRPDGSLRDGGCGLRVRATRRDDGSAGPSTLTYKGPRRPGPLKTREEWEVSVSDAATSERIMAGCGFMPVLTYEKRRESWTLDGCRVELDEPARLGLFVEIEGPDEAAIAGVQASTGLAGVELVRESYVRLLVRYCQKHGIVERRLLLT